MLRAAHAISLILASTMLAASDYDVLEMASPDPHVEGVASAAIGASYEWGNQDLGSSVRRRDASASVTACPMAGTDVIVAADHEELTIAGAPLSMDRLIKDEFELAAHRQDADGNAATFDVSIESSENKNARLLDHLDLSAVFVLHPQAHSPSSFMYAIWGTTQPYYHLPPVLPGIAYCLSLPSVRLVIGVPFSAIAWNPSRSLTISANVADSARIAASWKSDDLSLNITGSWTPEYFRSAGNGRGHSIIWEETAVEVGLTVAPRAGIEASIDAGRVLERRLIDESSQRTFRAGPSWILEGTLEVDW